MSARRFFVEGAHADGDQVVVSDADAHKIVHVLRLRSGDGVEVVDSAATVFDGELSVSGGTVRAKLSAARRPQIETFACVDVAQGMPKGQKMDFVVEKLTELGVSAILPFESERSVARNMGVAKLERWRRLAKSAAQQSGRATIPAVSDPEAFERIVSRFPDYDVVLFPWEVLHPHPLRATLPQLVAGAKRILVVIGPEGGFSHAEADLAADAGAHLVSLGGRILRTETAALALLAVLGYLLF
ncbi:MAG: 16S rRNA (uracil(1498)-N(3))-methyltransferase [Candidatus Baltobacteraceae bacterium]